MYHETAHDYQIKYRDTFLTWKKDENTLIPCKVIDFHQESSSSKTVFAKIKSFPTNPENSMIFNVKAEDLNFKFLPRGCINLSSSVIVLNEASPKNGEHKYRAGMSQHNTYIIDPFALERELLHSTPVEFENYTVLNAIIENKYDDPKECLENVISYKRLGQAFHPDYFFGLKYRPNGCMLFKRDYMVGRTDMSTGQIILKEYAHHLYEELSEFGFSVKREE